MGQFALLRRRRKARSIGMPNGADRRGFVKSVMNQCALAERVSAIFSSILVYCRKFSQSKQHIPNISSSNAVCINLSPSHTRCGMKCGMKCGMQHDQNTETTSEDNRANQCRSRTRALCRWRLPISCRR